MGSWFDINRCLLTDVLISKFVRKTDPLWLMSHRLSVHNGDLELLHDGLVNSIALYHYVNREQTSRCRVMTYEILDCASACSKHNWSCVIWHFTLWLGVDSSETKLLPHLFHEFVDVPAMLGANWASIWDTVEEVELLYGDGIDLVQCVDDWYVRSTLGLQDVDEIVNGCIAADGNIGRGDLVF